MLKSREDPSLESGPAEGSSSHGPMSQGLIAAIVVSAVAVLVVLALTVIVCFRFAESTRLHKGKARSGRNGGGGIEGGDVELDSFSGKYAATSLSGDARHHGGAKGRRWKTNHGGWAESPEFSRY